MRPFVKLLGAGGALAALPAVVSLPFLRPDEPSVVTAGVSIISVALACGVGLGLAYLFVPGGPKPSRHYRKRVRDRR